MTAARDHPDTIVFDTEPLIAYFCDESGSDTVETYIEAVEGSADGYISAINLAEVHYVVRAIDGEERADAIIDVLAETGIRRVDTEETWPSAADFKFRYSPALGDAFALATATHVDGMLLVGADDDYDDVDDVSITRFRTDPA
ncbi:putative nucleic acid-binding protein [Halarchaeum rubridurum]|uniref:Ribonuclease VapC n=1 Tax=Halarchaeum rubridurum TaxID=489911 RepID=A0A830G5E5_9EURY|nr:PIN domain-containing protein [Halarchaeum rubridurum]MBP1955640.1 putative nucleic acid-binding protein [Halarchaeum rubridurum]GGM76826.1 PIN domain nuclease [Halarchaeum rubridurum]